ncbi:MAG: twin transmembrane helix small protein [Pseudomonadales bacterium]|nr:twin transmembrane helix small protein [Pseudomonadales bacterium]
MAISVNPNPGCESWFILNGTTQRRFPLLKAVIVLLMLALVASLGSGFYFLMKDQGDKTQRRTMHSLGVRLTLAICLVAVIVYGVATGQLGHGNPWDAGLKTDTSRQSSSE